jgi:hypothetical protein
MITQAQQRELSKPLQEEKETLVEGRSKLAAKAQRLQEARELLAYVEPVARKMAETMTDLTEEEKIIVIRAYRRIWLDSQNKIDIELFYQVCMPMPLQLMAFQGLLRVI